MPPTRTLEGLEAAEELDERCPEVAVLVLSNHVEARYAMRLLERRTQGIGYLLKGRIADLDRFVEALRLVASGGCAIDPEVVRALVERRRRQGPLAELTDREREMLSLMAEGLSNRGLSRRLFLSERTIEAHVKSIFSKLDLPRAPDDNRRVLAVVKYLDAR
jgi:DNA-binding NarL/FixJ family response regulator